MVVVVQTATPLRLARVGEGCKGSQQGAARASAIGCSRTPRVWVPAITCGAVRRSAAPLGSQGVGRVLC